MLSKKNKEMNPNQTDTLIGEGSTVEGNIKSQAGLRIEGKVTGDIECTGDVTIGEKGSAHSNIKARNVINAGTIEGSVESKGTLNVTSTGKVIGDINVSSLIIAQGGIFQGSSTMELKAYSPQKLEEDSSAKKNGKEKSAASMQKASSG
ncbi:bactofilin family protein [Marinicrinis lubricantis]|uniref:Polymer-forming cytoskeletal protein n=1 Tax=Marinicrinis lubricantis TaxID=2086470 RepID=A0ABW1IRD0_9BACL